MMHRLTEFAVGLLFGLGLILAGMTDPGKVIGFLDLAGTWDPSLALVMGGAIMVGVFAFTVPWLTKCKSWMTAAKGVLPRHVVHVALVLVPGLCARPTPKKGAEEKQPRKHREVKVLKNAK